MTRDAMVLCTVFLVLGVAAILGESRRSTPHPGVSVHLSHRDRKMNVQYFNDLRRDVGAADMNELTWDLSMAKEARRLGRSCDFDEDPYSEYSSALYKQLFDPTARPGEIIMNAIRFWAGQKSNLTRYGWQSCRERNTCNYIKMITAKTEKAACSLTRCSSMRNQREDEEASLYFVTCLFSPRSQMTEEPFSTDRKCSRCPLYSGCRRGLCSLNGSRYNNAIRPPQNKNRIVPLGGKDYSSKGRILNEHRYLDASGNIRIRTQPKYLAQKGRRPSYIHRPPATRNRQQRRRQNAGDSRRTAAVRGIPPQSARVKRQATSYDYQYQLMLRRREEQRRREEERNRREREQRERWVAQQLRQRGEETRNSGDLERRHLEEQRRRVEELRRQREEEIRQQRELRQRQIEEEQRRRERQRESARQGRRRQVYGPARLESPAMNSTEKFQLTQVHNTLRGTQLAELSWSSHLERWARYVIRCEIQYPGPVDTFTNFGKIDTTSYVYNVVYDWGAEGSDIAQRLNKGCRTPSDRESCNHNVIIRNPFIRSFACATLDCGRRTQLTCIYK